VKKKCKNEENINRSQEEKLWQNGVNRPDTRSRDVKIMKIMIHIKNCFSLEISVLLSISSRNNLKLKINFRIWLQYWSYPDVHIYDKKFPDKKKRKNKNRTLKIYCSPPDVPDNNMERKQTWSQFNRLRERKKYILKCNNIFKYVWKV